MASRFEPTDTGIPADHGVPLFLEQIVETLQEEQGGSDRAVEAGSAHSPTLIGRTAALHGAELLGRGFSVNQVVHEYGDVCQCVTALAVEQGIAITADEFRTLNRCLDNAIADAVASFGMGRQRSIDRQAETLRQRIEDFAVEHRRLTGIALQSFGAIRTGNIGTGGATGTLLDHALKELGGLTERAVQEIILLSADSPVASL